MKKTFKSKLAKYLLVILLVAILNILRIYIQDNFPRYKVEINENVEIIDENEVKKDINDVPFLKLSNILTKVKAQKIFEYKEFVGTIRTLDELTLLRGVTKDDVNILKKYFLDYSKKRNFTKYDINKISRKDLEKLGFTKEEIKYIFKLRKGKISSDIDLKGKVNEKLLKQYLIY